MFVAGFFRTGQLVRGSDIAEIAKVIEMGAVIVALFALFCFAVLREKGKGGGPRRGQRIITILSGCGVV
jgi:hypothetical protein